MIFFPSRVDRYLKREHCFDKSHTVLVGLYRKMLVPQVLAYKPMYTEPKTNAQGTVQKRAKIPNQPPTGWDELHPALPSTDTQMGPRGTQHKWTQHWNTGTHRRGEHTETGRLIQGHITLPQGRQEGAHAHICAHSDTHTDAVTYVMHMKKPYSSQSPPRPPHHTLP